MRSKSVRLLFGHHKDTKDVYTINYLFIGIVAVSDSFNICFVQALQAENVCIFPCRKLLSESSESRQADFRCGDSFLSVGQGGYGFSRCRKNHASSVVLQPVRIGACPVHAANEALVFDGAGTDRK